jgi:hypothetical protein
MRVYCFTVIVAATALFASRSDAAPTSSQPAAGSESLGSELLDDLSPTLPASPAKLPQDAIRPNQPLPPNDRFAPDPPDRAHPRFDDLGEDIGAPSGPLSLVRVRQGMERAETLLADPRAVADARMVQKQVVAQLDQLIEELSKQCQACQQGAGQPKPVAGQRLGPKPGQPKTAMGRGKSAPRDSSDRLDQSSGQPGDNDDSDTELDALVKDLWGHLPERSREQMLQSFSTEFLPKYELEIEEYYRRLSEKGEADTAEPR